MRRRNAVVAACLASALPVVTSPAQELNIASFGGSVAGQVRTCIAEPFQGEPVQRILRHIGEPPLPPPPVSPARSPPEEQAFVWGETPATTPKRANRRLNSTNRQDRRCAPRSGSKGRALGCAR